MVLYVVKYDVHPDKVEAYTKWAQSAIPRVMAVKGLVEIRAYRAAAGTHRYVVTYEFADMAAWASWQSHEDVQKIIDKFYTFATNGTTEVWGPSPVVPKPVRPGK